uniref:fructose-2,6-bisphosphatase TIGAR-like n=1 Tax=Styela clava TaxID=7725 RepID=UPI0019399932|nr:fructose-2,6-bisphosphatase TIGAR-like [Styela clava]
MLNSSSEDSVPSFTLTLVRHGETEANVFGLIQGQGVDSSLNKRGKKQSGKIKSFLSSEIFDLVYSSDLKRAKQTCEIILEQSDSPNEHQAGSKLSSEKIIYDKRLRERCFGVMEGRYYHEMDNVAFPSDRSAENNLPDGAESIKELEARAFSFFKDLCEHVYNSFTLTDNKTSPSTVNILIVSHGGLLASLSNVFAEKFHCSYPRGVHPAQISVNTARSKFTVMFKDCTFAKNKKFNLKSIGMECNVLNDSSHLYN